MPIWWGRVTDAPDTVVLPVLAAAGLLAATGIALAAGEPQWRDSHLVAVEPAQQRIVVLPRTPDHWRLCDGPTGACFEIRHLRAATAAMAREPQP